MKTDLRKAVIQDAAKLAWVNGGEWGGLFMATGSGKSKIAIDIVTGLCRKDLLEKKILLVVPTEKLRDDNWREEFDKWGAYKEYKELKRSCYVSITNLEMQYYDLVILDECHNLTERNSNFFTSNTVKRVLALSATPPDPKGNDTEKEKVILFKQFRIKPDYIYTLEDAVRDGVVAPFEIRVVEVDLDDKVKYVKAGTEAKRFYQTEKAAYDYVSSIIKKMQYSKNDAVKWKYLDRMRIIQNSIAKAAVARIIIDKYCKGDRYLVFCGSIAQAESLCGTNVYHSKSSDVALTKFQNLEIDEMGCVEALNEGINVKDVDQGVLVQISASVKDFIQRIGRLIRKRPGHKAIVWVIILRGTQDAKWAEKAFEGIDKSLITYIDARNI